MGASGDFNIPLVPIWKLSIVLGPMRRKLLHLYQFNWELSYSMCLLLLSAKVSPTIYIDPNSLLCDVIYEIKWWCEPDKSHTDSYKNLRIGRKQFSNHQSYTLPRCSKITIIFLRLTASEGALYSHDLWDKEVKDVYESDKSCSFYIESEP